MYNNNYFQPVNNRPPVLKGRPVASLDEVRAVSIDFDGSVFYFPDLANKKIYTKQINIDGTATLNMYELKPIPTVSANDYITRAEFESALMKLGAASTSEELNKPSSNAQDGPAPYKF